MNPLRTAFNLRSLSTFLRNKTRRRGERALSARLHESINKHRRLPVSTTSGWHISIVLPLRISAEKVERERENPAFETKKPSIPGSNELSSRSHPPPPPPYFPPFAIRFSTISPIVQLVPLVHFHQSTLTFILSWNGPGGSAEGRARGFGGGGCSRSRVSKGRKGDTKANARSERERKGKRRIRRRTLEDGMKREREKGVVTAIIGVEATLH